MAGTWTILADVPTGRAAAAVAEVGGLIYVIGGSDYGGVNQAYDPALNSWTTGLAAMTTPRDSTVGFNVGDKIYCIGGNLGSSPFFTNKNEEYNPATDSWATKAVMTTARDDYAGAVWNGIIYTAGGLKSGSVVANEVEAYDPAADTWSSKAVLPAAWEQGVMAAHDGYLYFFGGKNGGVVNANVYKYDIAGDSWSTPHTTAPTSRRSPAIGMIDDLIYVVGGFNLAGTAQSINDAYDPVGNTFSLDTSMPAADGSTGHSTYSDGLYLFGGGLSTSSRVFLPQGGGVGGTSPAGWSVGAVAV